MDTLKNTKLQQAKEQVALLKGFYTHLTIYLIFVLVFTILNYISTDFPWAIFPIVGWGLGVLSHAAGTFDWNPFFGKDWEARKIKELLENE